MKNLHSFQELSGDDKTLDLCSSFVDLVNLGISHQLFHRVLTVVSITPEHLNRITGRLVRDVRSIALKVCF